MQSWEQWQSEVVTLLRCELDDALSHISLDDVDWFAWHPLYAQGRSPRSAIERALERNL
jgi:hypothetical protein